MKKYLLHSGDRLAVLMLGATARAYSGALGAMGQERTRFRKFKGVHESRQSNERKFFSRMEENKWGICAPT
jgi:hypothetical protein